MSVSDDDLGGSPVRGRHFGFAVATVVVSLLGCKRPAPIHESSDDEGWGEIRAQVRPEARSAFDTLLLADEFDSSNIGIADQLSPNAAAVRTLIRDPAAVPAFEAFWERGGPVSRLYALAAFWYLRPSDYPARMSALRDRYGRDTLRTMRGCIGGRRTVEDLLGMDFHHPFRLAPGTDLYEYKCPKRRDIDRFDFASGSVPINIVEGEVTHEEGEVMRETCLQSRRRPEFLQPRP